jgi:hypothetical protein
MQVFEKRGANNARTQTTKIVSPDLETPITLTPDQLEIVAAASVDHSPIIPVKGPTTVCGGIRNPT